MRAALLAATLLMVAAGAHAQPVTVRHKAGNGDCLSLGQELTGRWIVDGSTLRHGPMAWPLVNDRTVIQWAALAHGTSLDATVTRNPTRLILAAPKWGCKWVGE